jgi:hypothetical protein
MSLLDALAEIHDLAKKGPQDWDLVAGIAAAAIAEARVGLVDLGGITADSQPSAGFGHPISPPVLRYGE